MDNYNGRNCPNCGAPIEGNKCSYCGTPFIDISCIDINSVNSVVFRYGDSVIKAKMYVGDFTVNYHSCVESVRNIRGERIDHIDRKAKIDLTLIEV